MMLQNIHFFNSRKTYLVLLGVVIFLGFLALKNKLWLISHQEDPNRVALMFWESLKDNNESMARLLVLANQQERVTLWIDSHQPTKCRFLSDLLTSEITYSAKTNSTQTVKDIAISCETSSGIDYCFNVEGIWVKKVGEKWFVADWDNIYEANDLGDCFP